jgi:hypothetical protein
MQVAIKGMLMALNVEEYFGHTPSTISRSSQPASSLRIYGIGEVKETIIEKRELEPYMIVASRGYE